MIKTAISVLLGCLLCLNLGDVPGYGWLLALLLPILAWFRQVALSAFIVGLLWAGFQAQLRLDDQLSSSMAGLDIKTSGTIASIPEQHGNLLRFNFKPDSDGLPGNLRLSWYQIDNALPRAGERWQLTVRFKPPRGMMNPGGFDYENGYSAKA